MMLTGSEIFIKCLVEEGVDVVFGIPGGAILHAYDVLVDYPITHILCRHEQGATHAAEGYARVTGRPGVVMVTSGPGATNTVTAITDALMDSIPIVVFTGQVPTLVMGADAFQEADTAGITRACTKHNTVVKRTSDLPQAIKEAFHIAGTGRPGPVLVDLPKDTIMGRAEFTGHPKDVSIRGYKPPYEGDPDLIKEAAALIAEAKRPVIYGGGGIINADGHEEVRELAEITSTPVTITLMGLGGFPASNPLWLGMLGMHGTYWSNMAMMETDLMIAVGSRFDDRVTGKLDEFAQNCKVIHIDIDPSSINKNVPADVGIVGDVKGVLVELNEELRKIDRDWEADHAPWLEQIAKWKEAHPLRYESLPDVIMPQRAIQEIYEATKDHDPIVSTGVGQHQMWTAQYFHLERPRRFLTSGGLGTMGYGFPAAMGAQAAFPDKLVIDIDGDGSFMMTLQELATIKQFNLKVKIYIINNTYLGMVRQWQQLFYSRRYSEVGLEVHPDFVALAESFGVAGLRAEHPDELRSVIEKSLEIDGPVVVDIRVAKEENVFPMIPAGAALGDILDVGEKIPDQLFQGWR
jgi:acetolactate synthase-1/2/3 large subunit